MTIAVTEKGRVMSRYIDADKVLKELHLNHNDVIYIDKRDTAKRIEKIKGIDIVRCKECRYKDMEICPMYRLVVAGVRKHDDFCSYGEREGE